MKVVLLFLICFLLVITIPILIFYFLYKWLYKKGYTTLAWLAPALIVCILLYPIYTAFYPRDEFYIEEYETNTALSFPASGEILAKEATYPDIHGDYLSWAVIALSKSDYLKVYEELQEGTLFKKDTSSHPLLGNTLDFLHANGIDKSRIRTILYTNKNAQFKIGFMADERTILFECYNN